MGALCSKFEQNSNRCQSANQPNEESSLARPHWKYAFSKCHLWCWRLLAIENGEICLMGRAWILKRLETQFLYWTRTSNQRVVTMPTLSSLVAPQVVVMTMLVQPVTSRWYHDYTPGLNMCATNEQGCGHFLEHRLNASEWSVTNSAK